MECDPPLPLLYDNKFDFWCCPECRSEWWPARDTLKEIEQEKRSKAYQEKIERQMQGHISSAYKPALSFAYVPGTRSGGRSGGKRRQNKKRLSQTPAWFIEQS